VKKTSIGFKLLV